MTYNFATALTETTNINLSTLTTTFQLVSSFQNCELKQKASSLATALSPPLNANGNEGIYILR